VLQTADGLKLDYSALNEQTQRERMAEYSKKLGFFAGGVDTWEDCDRAQALGYDFFQGSFFIKPLTGRESIMRSLSAPALRIMSELSEPEPSFREITNIIEHDLTSRIIF
jgi:EAL and modified HD-GYP domain-containing signal transduction protein